MKKTNWFRVFWVFAALVVSFLAACSSGLSTPVPVSSLTLIAYSTRTPTPTVPAPTPAITPAPTISPTPVSYNIASGDTLSSIARRFDITLDALLAANPGVSPQALTVGQAISIPSGSQASDGGVLASNSANIEVGAVLCLPSGDGTACLVPVRNPHPDALENIKVLVTLLDEGGRPVADQEAILPLNVLPPGRVLPAPVFFKGLSSHYSAQAQLLASVRLSPGDSRYLRTDIQNLLVSIAWDGLSANVQGQVFLSMNQSPAITIWLVAVAFDQTGQIIGYRRWEWDGPLQPGEGQPFNTTVYGLGSSIDHVEVLVEARP